MVEHLNATERAAILDLAAIAQSLKTPLTLIGANARRLAFDIPFAFASPRTTRDWDFALPMQSWEAYAHFYQRAIQGPNATFRASETAHRIIHAATGTLVDLIPFGGVADADGRICWPQSRQVMSVRGFEEAQESSGKERLPNGVEIGIVTPAMLAALKIMAFAERKEQYSRDLQDLWFILERYARPESHESRVFDELAEHFPDPIYFEHGGSLLLGWDIATQCRPPTVAEILPPLQALADADSPHLEPLLARSGDLEEQQAERQRIAGEFAWLEKGIELARKLGHQQ